MSLDLEFDRPWHRHHDGPPTPGGPKAKFTVHPASLEKLIEICQRRPDRGHLHALGTHWALSEAARSDSLFIETHDPDDQHVAMGRTLKDVVPGRLDPHTLEAMARPSQPTYTLVHVEAGKRIAQLYAELDQVDPMTSDETLAGYMKAHHDNPGYAGPWAFHTLGGAGGQTIVGALSTGTHGGDFDRPPVADAVVAIHLVVDGGMHYWIERSSSSPVADEEALKAFYGADKFGGSENFKVKRDDDLFNAVLVSAGRFGVIYSVVLVAVPQYSLYERRLLADWSQVKDLIADRSSWLYTDTPDPFDADFTTTSVITNRSRFLQIVVSLTPYGNFTRNRVGITQRWELKLPPDPAGRAERVGAITNPKDPILQGPRFANAGTSFPYHRPDHPHDPPTATFLEIACSNPSFLKGLLEAVVHELEDLVESDGAVVGATLTVVAAAGGGAVLLLLVALAAILLLLKEIVDSFDEQRPLGVYINKLKDALLKPPIGDPDRVSAGLLVWQMIALKIFESQQERRDVEAISYAIMDAHDYHNVGCEVNGDSLEVFFDATDPMLIAFIDLLIAFELRQELRGGAWVGYVSLRFTPPTQALIGMQKWPLTCSIEIAGLRDVTGSMDLIAYASNLARNHNVRAILHWGQRNDSQRDDIERIFGDVAFPAASNLGRWRAALGTLTDNGRLDGFSNAFTRQTGLEVVTPALRELAVSPPMVRVGERFTVSWDARNNPPGSSVALTLIRNKEGPREHRLEVAEPGGLAGSYAFDADEAGSYVVGITVRQPGEDVGLAATSSVVVQVEDSD
jgi:hypothetical protein